MQPVGRTASAQQRPGKLRFGLLLLSVCFGAAFVLGRHVTYLRTVYSNYRELPFLPLTAADIPLFLAAAGLFYAAAGLWRRWADRLVDIPRPCREAAREKRIFYIGAAVLFLCALPYLFSFYPGCMLADGQSSVQQYLSGYTVMDNQHPVLYTLFLGAFLKIGSLLGGDLNLGIFLYCLVQTALLAMTEAAVLRELYRLGTSRVFLFGAFLYYAIVPLFPKYGLELWKDPLFGCAMLWLTLLVLRTLLSEGADLADKRTARRYLCAAFLVCFLRNNGIAVAGMTGLFLLLLYGKRSLRCLMGICAAAAAFLFMMGAGYRMLHIRTVSVIESIGIPMQQIAACAVDGQAVMSETERVYVQTLMPEETWKSLYKPFLVDDLKGPSLNHNFLGGDLPGFFRTWAGLMLKNPGIGVRAYLYATYGFWDPVAQDSYGYCDMKTIDNSYGVRQTDLLEQAFHFSVKDALESFNLVIGTGTLLWILFAALSATGRGKLWMAAVPIIANWMTIMVATPVAFSMRYLFILLLALPLMLALPGLAARRRRGSGA